MNLLSGRRFSSVAIYSLAAYLVIFLLILLMSLFNRSAVYHNKKTKALFNVRELITIQGNGEIVLNLESIGLDNSLVTSKDKVCITSVEQIVSNNDINSYHGFSLTVDTYNLDHPVCNDHRSDIPGRTLLKHEMRAPSENDLYVYPYDRLRVNYSAEFKGYEGSEENPFYLIPVNMEYVIDLSGKEVYDYDVANSLSVIDENLGFTVGRSPIYRFLVPAMTLCLIVIMFASLLIQDMGTFFQTVFAMLFGLWGLRQVFVPFNADQPMILDVVFLMLYATMIVIVMFWMTQRYYSDYYKRKLREEENEAFLESSLLGTRQVSEKPKTTTATKAKHPVPQPSAPAVAVPKQVNLSKSSRSKS